MSVAVPASARPISTSRRAAAVVRQARREVIAYRRRRGSVRTTADSAREYEARWSGQGRDARWRKAGSVAEAVRFSSYDDVQLEALLDFRAYRVPSQDFFGWRAAKIAEVVGTFVQPDEPVVELGCGVGKNLLALAAFGYSDLTGIDISPSAIQALRDQFAFFGAPVQGMEGNLLNLAPVSDQISGRTVLTNYVLEQLPRHLDVALGQIASAAPRQVLHIEPCADRLPGRRVWERWPSVWHTRSHDYQRDLLTVLRNLELSGLIRVTDVRPLGFSPYMFHSAVLIRWETNE
jgi:SAM-dependent methyltransferase